MNLNKINALENFFAKLSYKIGIFPLDEYYFAPSTNIGIGMKVNKSSIRHYPLISKVDMSTIPLIYRIQLAQI